MTTYDSTLNPRQAAELMRRCEGPIVILTHAKPDGDAFGCAIALATALRLLDRRIVVRFAPPVSANLLTLPGAELATIHDASPAPQPLPDEPGLIVILDTGARSQLDGLWPYVEPRVDRAMVIDHHLSGDIPVARRLVDSTAAATAEPLAEIIDHLLSANDGAPTDASADVEASDASVVIATGLYAALASDTGWFRFSSTSPRSFRLAARLLEAGVDHADLFRRLEQTERPAKIRLLARALTGLELLADDRAALMTLRRSDFDQTGARDTETDRLIDVPQMIESVRAAALVTERDGGTVTSVSFRSKPGVSAVNAAELAGRFGGGGHARAAGARVKLPLDQALPRIRAALIEAASHCPL